MKLIIIIFAITICAIISNRCNADQSLNCGDWHSFKDEKCFKIYSTKDFKTYEEAKNTCKQLESGATIVSINSLEEQSFLVNLINKTLLNDIWLNGEYSDLQLKWSDGSNVTSTNWAEGNPKNLADFKCVQMSVDYSTLGRWVNVVCEKENLVVCQKDQNWLVSYLEKIVKELRESLKNATNNISNIDTELNESKKLISDSSNKILALENRVSNLETELKQTKTESNQNIIALESRVAESLPAGTIAYFASLNAPKGWLKANGDIISRSNYADLFSKISVTFGEGDGVTTFKLPDLRGEFIRGWSDGRSVDKERKFGSFQWGSTIPLAGYINGSWEMAISTGFQDRWGFAGAVYDNGYERRVAAGESRDGIIFPSDGSLEAAVSSLQTSDRFSTYGNAYITNWNLLKGTRPRNIALMACIKF